MKTKLLTVAIILPWLYPSFCSAVQPGYYPPRLSEVQVPETESQKELRSLMKTKSVGLWIQARDKIRIWSRDPDFPIHATLAFHTQAEIADYLRSVQKKQFLFAQISAIRTGLETQQSVNLVREVEPFLDKLGYKRILIFNIKPRYDGDTLTHPENGTGGFDIFVFKDKHYLERDAQ